MKIKEIIYFSLLLIVFTLYPIYQPQLLYKIGGDIRVSTFTVAFITASILALVFYLLFYKVKNESFMFEVSKYKQCQGGAYMHQSDPELQKYCSSLPQDIINNINCPKNVVYTPESNASWNNPRCNSEGTPTSD